MLMRQNKLYQGDDSMAQYSPAPPGFKLVPFMQNKPNAVSFFLTSPYADDVVLNFLIELQDYTQPDVFFDMLSIAVDSILLNQGAIPGTLPRIA